MANPRKHAAWNGVAAQYLTFAYDSTIVYSTSATGGSVSVGLAVTLVSNGTVGLTQDANPVIGKLVTVEADGFCTVQVAGGCTLPSGNAQTLTANSRIVGALGASSAKGYIRNANSAVAAETVAASGRVIDATTGTAVVVLLNN